MNQQRNLVMLPTDKSDLILFTDSNTLKYGNGEQRNKYAKNSPQHLYILSDTPWGIVIKLEVM